MAESEEERVERGRRLAEKLWPPRAGSSRGGLQLPVPREIARDWRRFSTATVLGDVWSRPGLDLKSRSMIALAAFTVLNRTNELPFGVRSALSAGVSREEICEIIMQMAIYGGFPVAVEGMRIVSEVFEQIDAESKGGA